MHWRELKIWQRAHNFVLKCYRVTATFPKTEVYGLVDQIKKGGVFSAFKYCGRTKP